MKLTVVSNPVQGGTTTCQPASDTGSYYPTDNVTVTAAANPGYKFVNWTGDVAEIEDTTQSTIIVPMHDYYIQNTEDIEITANFARQRPFPWGWVGGGVTALLLVLLAMAGVKIVHRRQKDQADAGAP